MAPFLDPTSWSENRIVVNPARENPVTEDRSNPGRYSESPHDSREVCPASCPRGKFV